MSIWYSCPHLTTAVLVGVLLTGCNIFEKEDDKEASPTAPSSQQAVPQATYAFSRLCAPKQAGVDVTITEAGGDIGLTVTSVVIEMIDQHNVRQVYKTLSGPEIATQWGGSNRLAAGETRVVSYVSAYPGDVDTDDSTANVTIAITDDAGNASTLEQKNIAQLDKC